jgi:tellurite resistance protein
VVQTRSYSAEDAITLTPDQKVDVLRAACCVAGIDTNTTSQERALIDKLAKGVGCGTASVNAMIARAQSDSEFHRQQFTVLKADPQETIAILIEVAMADGGISDSERIVLKEMAESLEIPAVVFDQLMTKVSSMLEKGES